VRKLALCLLPLGALGAALAVSPRALAGDADDGSPARLFTARCAECHAVPDPALRGDRAWLGQVQATA